MGRAGRQGQTCAGPPGARGGTRPHTRVADRRVADRLARRNPLRRWWGGRFGALPFFWPVTHGLQNGGLTLYKAR